MECGNCGSTENLTIHHIVPKSLGGTERASNKAALCWPCHGLAHGKSRNFGQLVAAGYAKARMEGRIGGQKPKLTPEILDQIRVLHAAGKREREIAAHLGLSTTTINKGKRRAGIPSSHRMTPEIRAEIIRRLELGHFTRAIAREMGWSQGRIQQIKKKLNLPPDSKTSDWSLEINQKRSASLKKVWAEGRRAPNPLKQTPESNEKRRQSMRLFHAQKKAAQPSFFNMTEMS